MEILDSLSVHSKMSLLHHIVTHILKVVGLTLPSPPKEGSKNEIVDPFVFANQLTTCIGPEHQVLRVYLPRDGGDLQPAPCLLGARDSRGQRQGFSGSMPSIVKRLRYKKLE